MQNSYGYIRGTEGVDGDHIDVFLSDHVDDWNGTVYVVDQVKEDGSFDEHKVMYGFNSAEEAREAYLSNYSPGWKGLGTITGVSKEEFKKWTDSSHRKTKPFAEYKSVKAEEGQSGAVDGIDTWQQNNNPHLQKTDGRPSGLTAADVEVRDGLVEIMREGGIDVSLDDVEGQRVLDEDREQQARLMGKITRMRQAEISAYFEGKDLSPTQVVIVNAFGNQENNKSISLKDKKGRQRTIIFRQGNEKKAGVQHSVFGHCDNNKDYYTKEEILLIPDVVNKGERNQEGKKIKYEFVKDGVTYTVTTEMKGRGELFTNFYTDRKPKEKEQGTSYTDEQHVQPNLSVPGANIRQNSETDKEMSEISQGFGSAATSLNQIPSGMKKVNWQPGTTNVDIGGGRFDTATEYLREQGVENLVFDPFNRNAEHNKEVAERVRDNKVDTATCHNVLNVIDSELSRANVILQAAKAIKPDGTAYFTVYEGDKSGVGRQTKSDSWQNNRPTKDYVREIEAYFDDVKVKNNVIVASKPKAVAEKSVWDFDGEYKGNDLRFFRTSSGEAYGFVKDGKMYIDPRIATSETPVHEYHHLWAEALEKANPEAWGKLKSELFGNKDLESFVRELYPEISDENELAHEMFAQFGGKRGAERLRAEEERMMSEVEDGVFGKARIKAMFNTLRQVLSKYWQMARDLFSGDNSRLKDMKLEDFADMAMGDLLRGHKPESERFNPGNKDIRYQFIGERGSSQADSSEERSYRMDNLEVARRMEKEGKEAKSIKLATGWERGADGKWRYEIGETPMNNVIKALRKSVEKGDREVSRLRDEADRLRDRAYRLDTRIPKRLDSRYSEEQKAKYREMRKERDRLYDEAEKKVEEAYELRDKIEAEGWSTTLGDVLGEDSELLRAYPSLASVKVVLKDRLEGAEGSFNSESHTIKLAVSDTSGKDLYKTLVHEVQHAVQHEEGFALGGNIRSITDMENRETAMEALRRDIPRMRLEEKELSTLLEDNERIRRMAEEKGIPSRTQWRMIEFKLDNLRDEKVLAEKLLEDFENGVENPRLYMSTGQRYYRRLAGEVEARNASRRAEMTDEERSNSLGSETEDVSREDQIFLYGDKGASESREEEDKALFTKAKERFGTTNDLREAGYILPDGTMLDFSGRHQMDEGADTSGLRGRRGVDHRDIKQLKYEKDGNTPSGMDVSMEDFIERGAIRIDGQYGSINLSRKPTAAQERVLRRLISRNDGYVTVEIGNGYDSEHYGEYDEGTRASKVLGDINRYFDDGILFRFSDSTEEFDATRDRAVEENGIVMPGLNERNVEVVPIEKMEDGRLHPFDLSLPETQKKRTIEKYAVEHGLTGDVNMEGGVVYVSKNSIGQFADDKHIQKSVRNGISPDVYISAILRIKDIIKNSVDCEIFPDRIEKNEKGSRDKEGEISKTSLMHVFYGAANIDGRDYSVQFLVKETKGSTKSKPYIYTLEEIELSDGHNDAVESGHTRKSDRTIPLSKILEKVEKTIDPEKNLLEESAKLDEQNNNGEVQDNVIGREAADTGETPVRWVRPGEWKKKVYALDDVNLRIRKVNEQMMSAGSKDDRDRLFDERSRLIGERQRIEKELAGIRPLRSDRQARESAERQWRRAHERGAELVEKLGLGDTVTMVDSIDDLEGSEKFGPRRRMAKGWYDPKTGKIVVVMGNHKGPQDVVQTILHEGVAHHGLRKLFGSRFDTFLDNVYENAADDIRKEIDAMAGRQGMDVRKATEEYLAKLAEDTDFDRAMDSGWWKQVKGWFLEMLRELGLDDFFGYDNLTDNELRYILWRSWKNLSEPDAYQNVFGGAEDVAVQYKLNVGNYGKNAGGDNLIENRIPKMTLNHGDDMQIRKMVSELSEQELRAAFNRVNDLMRDEEGLDPDEQEEAMRQSLFMDNLRNGRPRVFGLGKAEMALIDRQTDKYGSGMVTLRYELMSRLEKMKEGGKPSEHFGDGGRVGNATNGTGDEAKREGVHEDLRGRLSDMSDEDLNKEYLKVMDVVEKPKRIEKLRKSEPVISNGQEYRGKYELNNRSAATYINDSLRGTYINRDTGDKIKITRKGAFKVTRHDAENDAHLKSIALIPQMLEKAIFISEEPNNKSHSSFDRYRYYAVGLKMDGEDYTAKLVIGVKNGYTYYDHSLTEIEKTSLLDRIDEISSSFTDKEVVDSVYKDKRLLSILQINPEEISLAESQMRDILIEMKHRDRDGEGVLFRDGDEEAPSGTGGTDPDAEGYDAGSMSLDEQIAKGMADLAQKNKDNVQLRVRAMQTIGGNLQKLRQAMALQREYDRKTVDGIVRLSRLMMGSGIYTGFSPYEVSRLMGMVNRAAGREDITKEADKVVDLMVDHQLKELDTLFRKHLRTKASKLNSSGVEVQAGLDIAGQRMMTAMRESMDDVEGQRVLDEDKEHQARMMGSKTNRKKAKIAKELEGRQLTKEQQAVVDVFTGKKNNATIIFMRDGRQRSITIRKGNEEHAGIEHSLYGHYDTTEGVFTTDDILKIPYILSNGVRKPVKYGKEQRYEYIFIDENGIEYTVATEFKSGRENFVDFYSNWKIKNKESSSSLAQNTPESAHSFDENDSSGANIRQNSEIGKETSENSQGFGSAATSLNQIPSGMKKVNWQHGITNVDIGGGRFDTATKYLREQGVENLVFDPFNRNAEHNKEVAERVRDSK